MADKRCENGHFIDESWDICPYCPQDRSEPEIPIVKPRSVEERANVPPPAAAAPVRSDSSSPEQAARRSTVPGSPVEPPSIERTVAAAQVNAQKRYVVGWLVALNGPARGESFPIRMGRNVIGRDRNSDVVLNDDQASSHHADLIFRPEEKRFILMDHNSTNGTYVNETEIEPRRDLAQHDVIRIASQRLLFTPLCHEGVQWDDEGPLK